MARTSVNERRRSERVPARLPIELRFESGTRGESSDTIDISANGVYFRSPRFIEPLTRLSLRLLLPVDGDGDGDAESQEAVEVEGIVVRVQPETASPSTSEYEIACYFTEITPEFRERLGSYVQSRF